MLCLGGDQVTRVGGMTTSRTFVLVRVLAVPFLLAGAGFLSYGLFGMAYGQLKYGDPFDAFGFLQLMVAGGLPVLVLASLVLLNRRREVAASFGLLLSSLPISLAALMGGDYAPWPNVAMVLGLILAVSCLGVLVSERSTSTSST